MAERHWNAHAFINIAVWLNLDSSGCVPSITEARVVFGYPAAVNGEATQGAYGKRGPAVQLSLRLAVYVIFNSYSSGFWANGGMQMFASLKYPIR